MILFYPYFQLVNCIMVQSYNAELLSSVKGRWSVGMQLDKEMFFKISVESVFRIYENVSDSEQLEFITPFSQELFPFMKPVLLFQLIGISWQKCLEESHCRSLILQP